MALLQLVLGILIFENLVLARPFWETCVWMNSLSRMTQLQAWSFISQDGASDCMRVPMNGDPGCLTKKSCKSDARLSVRVETEHDGRVRAKLGRSIINHHHRVSKSGLAWHIKAPECYIYNVTGDRTPQGHTFGAETSELIKNTGFTRHAFKEDTVRAHSSLRIFMKDL